MDGGVLKNRCTYLDVHKGADGFFCGCTRLWVHVFLPTERCLQLSPHLLTTSVKGEHRSLQNVGTEPEAKCAPERPTAQACVHRPLSAASPPH